mmetsp:Transcript_24271/g.72833  ORF Transcript_24271/g.72833 Transcript_24271/m.72833 type:complete len:92 (-) Transcript_24271:657-932(-)
MDLGTVLSTCNTHHCDDRLFVRLRYRCYRASGLETRSWIIVLQKIGPMVLRKELGDEEVRDGMFELYKIMLRHKAKNWSQPNFNAYKFLGP